MNHDVLDIRLRLVRPFLSETPNMPVANNPTGIPSNTSSNASKRYQPFFLSPSSPIGA
mgnify:CR=1 FL=1